jgi:hypothetical protein
MKGCVRREDKIEVGPTVDFSSSSVVETWRPDVLLRALLPCNKRLSGSWHPC